MTIIHMNEFERTRKGLSQQECTALLRECRELSLSRLGEALTRMMDGVDDALFELAEKAESNAQQTQYFDAMREVRLKRAAMEAAFRSRLLEGFNAEIRREDGVQSDADSLSLDGDSLDLVDDERLEEDLAVKNMITKIEVNCRQELGALNQRIGFLLGDRELARGDNPIGPRVICTAFLDACADIESGLKVKLIILKLFDRFVVGNDVLPLYQALNRLLTERGVLRDLRPTVKRQPGSGASVPDSGGAPAMEGEEQDFLATLQGLVPQGGGLPGLPGVGGAAGSGRGVPATPAFLQDLTLLQQGDAELAGGLAAIEAGAVAAGTVNVIRDIRQTAAAQGVSGTDAMIIDVVAMLFDYILDDDNIPDPMKAQIGRLQIPVLKVAMLDHAFFNRKSHPARRLLNALADAAATWDGEDDDSLRRRIEAVVQRVLVEFEDDIALFDELAEEFEDFLERERRRAAEAEARSARLLDNKERLRLAKQAVKAEVEARCNRHELPRFVCGFLVSYWQNLLLITRVKEGEDSLEWKRALATMDNLIWSVQPKQVQERERLVRMLPGLLGALREGMTLISMREDDFQDFLARLADRHAEVVNQAAVGTVEAAPPALDEDPLADLPPLGGEEADEDGAPVEENPEVTTATLHRLIREENLGDIEVEEITLGEDDPQTVEAEDEYLEMARRLEQGTWIEFRDDEGQSHRAKLTWISPISGNYLFTNRQGHKSADMTLQGLAAEFRRGSARIIEDVPLIDRAVSSLLDGLRGTG
ncbi:DUF1631 domain-containing protein [Thiohalobacter sp.]|uniref:DUF1631 domain-containing protein n=1 Tax=Thiohalobacter sp. TaxID=2025948 RepID=UPI00262A6DB2|nr:DUF1631 domain-containing protein [Thiohalobacter sp.]